MTNINYITAAYWSKDVESWGEAATNYDDIEQAIWIILGTRKRSVPHNPDFGSNVRDYIGYPIDEAIPHVIRETYIALRDYEPRIDIFSVKVEIDQHIMYLSIQYSPKDSTIRKIAEVTIQ